MKKNEVPKYKDNGAPISYAGKKEEKRKAKKALDEARKQELEQNFTPVKVNAYTTILVRKGKDIKKSLKRYEEALHE